MKRKLASGFVLLLLAALPSTIYGEEKNTCQVYFSVAWVGESAFAEWDRATIDQQVWWENDGKRKYPWLCWLTQDDAKEKKIVPQWVITLSSGSYAADNGPMDIYLWRRTGLPPVVPRHIDVNHTEFFATLNPVNIKDGNLELGRTVFTKSKIDKSKDVFKDAVKEIAKRSKK